MVTYPRKTGHSITISHRFEMVFQVKAMPLGVLVASDTFCRGGSYRWGNILDR
jgi:hypothetical protein